MKRFDGIKAEALTRAFMGAGRLLSHMSDAQLLKLMRVARAAMRDPAAAAGLDELIEAFAKGPPNTTLVRRMVDESRFEELKDFLFGAFFFKEMDIEDI